MPTRYSQLVLLALVPTAPGRGLALDRINPAAGIITIETTVDELEIRTRGADGSTPLSVHVSEPVLLAALMPSIGRSGTSDDALDRTSDLLGAN